MTSEAREQLPLDERYFIWLYSQVGAIIKQPPSLTFWNLLRVLYTTPFEDFLPNDDNRAIDGIELRYEFLEQDVDGLADEEWLDETCSFLEMLIALSRRMSFEANLSEQNCFWLMIDNLSFMDLTDASYKPGMDITIRYILKTINDRDYNPDGRGGLFPLEDPQEDQREVEIWYQMSAYLLENSPNYE